MVKSAMTKGQAWTIVVLLILHTTLQSLAQQPIQANAQPVVIERTNKASNATALPNDPMCKVLQADATLRSIAAVSQDRLVAVGDRGTVLVTQDAGRTWKQASAPTSVNLYDVKFIGERGFAVGGWIGLESGNSYGALLASNDGGQTWTPMKIDLPRLIGIAIHGNQLICWGDYSTHLSSSVFSSQDAGVTWSSALDGLGHANVAAVSSSGQLAAIDQLGRAKFPYSKSAQILAHPDANLNVLVHLNNNWVAAGEFGELISSEDGSNWNHVGMPLPEDVQRLCTWKCIESQAATVWLAGSPGSIVLRSNNFGQSWEVFSTGQKLPLNKLCFIDQSRGWAVGAAGTILATRDGGQSWYAQRKQPDRAALLTFAASPDFPSWVATATAVWDQKRVAAIVSLQHAEPIQRASVYPTNESRAIETSRQLGAADFATLDLTRSSPDQILQRLAVQLAVWQPEVVLTSFDERTISDETHAIRTVSKAVRLVASPEFQETLRRLHLSPWQVSKLVSTSATGQGEYTEDSQKFIRDLGVSIRDCMSPIPVKDRAHSGQLALQTTWSRVQSRANQNELFGGVALQSTSNLTSPIRQLGNYQLVMGRVHRDRALGQLISLDSTSVPLETWSSQLKFFLPSVPQREYSESIMRIVEGLLQGQQWQRADQVLIEVANNRDDLGLWAATEYLKLAVSSEMRDWIGIPMPVKPTAPTGVSVQSASYQDTWSNSPFSSNESTTKSSLANPRLSGSGSSGSVVSASAEKLLMGSPFKAESSDLRPVPKSGGDDPMAQELDTTSVPRPRSARECLAMIDSAMKIHSDLRSKPGMKMLTAASLRETQKRDAARMLLGEIAEKPHLIGWAEAAKQELALLDGAERALKWRVSVNVTAQPPILDGRLDEAMWRNAEPMRLSSLNRAKELPCEIRWCYDQEYLYVAIICGKAANQVAVAASKSRTHDADLKGLDYVELCFDIDRDYCSTIELAVAENGMTQDRCCGIAAYNPKWYVPVSSTNEFWYAELAIPLDQLTANLPNRETRWAISARRYGANGLVQSWSQLLTHQKLPEANGLLLFE